LVKIELSTGTCTKKLKKEENTTINTIHTKLSGQKRAKDFQMKFETLLKKLENCAMKFKRNQFISKSESWRNFTSQRGLTS
jgi:hypothetical protein